MARYASKLLTCKRWLFLFALLSTSLVYATPAQAEALPPMLISELQTGGCKDGVPNLCQENGTLEFIELHNPHPTDMVIDGWKLEYLSANHTGGAVPSRVIAELNGSVAAGGYVLLSYTSYLSNADLYFGQDSTATSGLLARSGGHIRLVNAQGTIVDHVSWGSATQIDGWWRAPVLNPDYSIKRILPGDPLYGSTDFTNPSQPSSPQSGGLLEIIEPTPVCDGLVLSEILPNAEGTDEGKEFIEVHNPTDADISLEGCSLRLGETGTSFNLPAITLAAGAYRAFFDSESGITLPNATGDTVWLLSTHIEEGISYGNSLADDQSWALVNGSWQATFSPTPGNANILTEAGMGNGGPEACEAGQERNPETNRCRKVATVASQTPCKPGHERNPETNRCRAIVTASATLTPCKPGQTRNPQTNRCRSDTAVATLQPCEPGQERNPETNRCRKVTSNAQLGAIHDVPSTPAGNMTGWWLAGAGAIGALGYGAYEWRRELGAGLSKIKDKFVPPGNP